MKMWRFKTRGKAILAQLHSRICKRSDMQVEKQVAPWPRHWNSPCDLLDLSTPKVQASSSGLLLCLIWLWCHAQNFDNRYSGLESLRPHVQLNLRMLMPWSWASCHPAPSTVVRLYQVAAIAKKKINPAPNIARCSSVKTQLCIQSSNRIQN